MLRSSTGGRHLTVPEKRNTSFAHGSGSSRRQYPQFGTRCREWISKWMTPLFDLPAPEEERNAPTLDIELLALPDSST